MGLDPDVLINKNKISGREPLPPLPSVGNALSCQVLTWAKQVTPNQTSLADFPLTEETTRKDGGINIFPRQKNCDQEKEGMDLSLDGQMMSLSIFINDLMESMKHGIHPFLEDSRL